MVRFHTKNFIKYDDYMTPKYAWENIIEYIPKNKVIWEAFYGDGKSGGFLKELGLDVIHEPIDFFKENRGDIIVSNPPFSLSKKIMERLLILDKPFILILPAPKICTSYFRIWKNRVSNNRINSICTNKYFGFNLSGIRKVQNKRFFY